MYLRKRRNRVHVVPKRYAMGRMGRVLFAADEDVWRALRRVDRATYDRLRAIARRVVAIHADPVAAAADPDETSADLRTADLS